MTWTVLALDQVQDWLNALDREAYLRVTQWTALLEQLGPQLGTPYVKPIQTSRHSNMKELRIQFGNQCFRILFAFDRKRQAILLAAADKVEFGVDAFYEHYVPIADNLFDDHIAAQQAKTVTRSEKGKPRQGKSARKGSKK